MVASRWPWRPRRSRAAWMSRSTSSPACNYLHLSTPNQRLAGFVQIVPLCAELFEGSPRQATLSGSNIDRSRNYNGPCGWSEMWVIASAAGPVQRRPEQAVQLLDREAPEPDSAVARQLAGQTLERVARVREQAPRLAPPEELLQGRLVAVDGARGQARPRVLGLEVEQQSRQRHALRARAA